MAPTPRTGNRRKQRRQEYGSVQKNWYKHQSRCIKTILAGPDESMMPNQNVMEPYWRSIMEKNVLVTPNCDENLIQNLSGFWTPISREEIESSRPSVSTAPGPDNITGRKLKAVPVDVLERLLNLMMWGECLSTRLSESKTIFIPKNCNSSEPGDFRPITIPSIVTRLLHRILAKRLTSLVKLDPRQRGFINSDGCSDNTAFIDVLLRSCHKNYKSCYLAS